MNVQLDQLQPGHPPAVVLGLGQNGLATVRSLGRLGIPVIGIDRNVKQMTARTRYCQKIQLSGPIDGEELISVLVDLGKRLPQRGVLFPSGDGALYNLSENRERLEAYYHFSFPAKEIVKLTLDKKKFYRFAAEHDIAIPISYFPEGVDDCRRIAEAIVYPCLIKPYQPSLGWRQHFPDHKLFRVNDAAELLRCYENVFKVCPDLIVQEIIPGRESNLSFSLTYFDSNGRPLGMFTGRKIRQYPPNFGTSSLAESHLDEDIAEKTIAILTGMRYTGYGSIEFKWDPRTCEFKAIEVTARTWFPHGIATACGLNLLQMAYCDLVGLPVPADDGFAEGVKWIHEDRDLRSALQQMRSGDLGVGEWLKSYRGRRTYALAALDDPGPAMNFLGRLIAIPWQRAVKYFGGG